MFKVGQKIRLTKPTGFAQLDAFLGRDLTVTHANENYVSFKEDTMYPNYVGGAWCNSRFEAVPEAPKVAAPKVNTPTPNKVARDKTGKFASRTKAPTILRNGSLYLVARKSKGKRVLQTARLKVPLKDGKKVVMSRHGQLFFATPKNLTLAPQSDVDAYLAEAEALKSK